MAAKHPFDTFLETLESEIRSGACTDFTGKTVFERFTSEAPLADDEYFVLAWFAGDLVAKRADRPTASSDYSGRMVYVPKDHPSGLGGRTVYIPKDRSSGTP